MSKKMIKIPSQIRLKTEFFEGYGIEELVKTIIVLCIAVVIGYIIYLFTKITLISTFFVIGSVVIAVIFLTKNRNNFSMADNIKNMRGVILIKLKQQAKTLNEFLNIKNIEESYLTTLDGQVILFMKVIPINTDLFSEEELENKMDSMSIEFSNEQYPYTILVIPRKVDIADFINEQQELKRKLQDDVTIQIVEKRIIYTHELVADKNEVE